METDQYPQFLLRPAMPIPGEGDMVEVVMWYNRNQANVLRMNLNDLRSLEDRIVEFLDEVKPEIGHHRQEAARQLGIKLPPEHEDVLQRDDPHKT